MIKEIVVTIGDSEFDCIVSFDYDSGKPEHRVGPPDNWEPEEPEEFTLNAFDVLDGDKSYKADYLIDVIEDDIIMAIKEEIQNES